MEHDNSRIVDFAPDISGSPHAEEDKELPVEIGNGAVDVESAAGEPTEDASAGTAEVIGVLSLRQCKLAMVCPRRPKFRLTDGMFVFVCSRLYGLWQ